MTRREALGLALATAAAAAGNDKGFKLGVASYSLRKLTRPQAIAALERMGIRYINIKEFHAPIKDAPDQWEQARRDFANAGITVLGVGNITFARNDPAEMRRNFEYAKALGAPLIVMAPTRETLPGIEALTKEFDIKAAIHNHGPEDKHFPAPKDVLDAVSGMDRRMGLCVDVGHTTRAGADVVQSIRMTGEAGRLHDIHIKDLADLQTRGSDVVVGLGRMPISAIFRELHRQRFTGGVMLEYEIEPDNPVPGMQRSFDYMRKVRRELGV